MAAAAAIIGLAGGIMGAKGTLDEGYAEADAMLYNADQKERNATIAGAQSVEDERKMRIYGRKALGGIRAAYGASGVTTDGSPMDVLQESAANAELDSMNVRYKGLVEEINLRNSALIDRKNAEDRRKGARLGAAAQVIGGSVKAGSQLYTGSTASAGTPSAAPTPSTYRGPNYSQ